MNPFVDPKKRGVTLPDGCKDLMDVLERETGGRDFKTSITDAGFVITVCLPGLHGEDVGIAVEGSTVRIVAKRGDALAPFETAIHVPSGYNLSAARTAHLNRELRILIPKSAV